VYTHSVVSTHSLLRTDLNYRVLKGRSTGSKLSLREGLYSTTSNSHLSHLTATPRMSHYYPTTSESYDESQTYYGWGQAQIGQQGTIDYELPQPLGQTTIDPNSLLMAPTPLNTSPSSCSSTLPSFDGNAYLDPSFTLQQLPFSQGYTTTGQEMPPAQFGYNMVQHPYPSPPTSIPAWSPYQINLNPLSGYNSQHTAYETGAGPSHQATVQPAAVFCNPELRDDQYPLTALCTPDDSAQATPSDEEKPQTLHKRLLISSALFQTASSIPTGQCSPSQSLKRSAATAPESIDVDDEDADADADSTEEDVSTTIVHPPVATSSKGGSDKKKRTRTAQACEPCRKRKAKVRHLCFVIPRVAADQQCSGCLPGTKCSRCILKRIDCVFEIVQKPQKVPPPPTPPVPHKKRRRNGLSERYTRPIGTSNIGVGLADPKQIYEEYIEKNNLLQLQLDGSAPYNPTAFGAENPYFGFVTHGDTHQPPDVSGYSSTMHPQYSLENNYSYHTTYPDGSSMISPLDTPSEGSYGSSPSHNEMILASPYDAIPFGSTTQDGYFPAMPSYPTQSFSSA
jgi:hypothetical protein